MISKKVMDEFEKYCKENKLSEKQREEKLALLEKLILKYKYEPGEAIGIVAAQSISEPATQMCADYNEKIVAKFKERIYIVTIGELVDMAIDENCEKFDGYEIMNLPREIEILVPSLKADESMEWKKITALCRHESPEFLLEVKTRSGRCVRATEYHSFVTKIGGRIMPIAGKDLKTGDKIPAIKNMSEIFTAKAVVNQNSILLSRNILNPSIMWDEIAEINKVKPSTSYVYDITVDENHTFTTSEGLIVHNTMRSYTMASQSDRLSKVTHGLPRLIEIFDTRKSFEKNMTIYLKPEHNTKEKAREVANTIKENRVSDIIISDSIDLAENLIELELENESDRDAVKAVVEKHIKDAEISMRGKKMSIKLSKENIKSIRKLKTKILRLHIRGIPSIENVVVIKDNEDWVIQTTGSNLKKVLQIDNVDISRTKTNDINQVYEVLGIEAARNMILQETLNTLGEQGLDVDIRHILLLADMMTFDGTVRDIGRYGVSGKKSSVLARANFEETKKHLINASFSGETDKLEGIIENIIVGQIAPVGTGMVKLGVDMEKMKQIVKKK